MKQLIPIALISGNSQSKIQNIPMAPLKKSDPKPTRRIRILVAKPGLDGHDRGALVLTRAFRDAGMEVIYTGFLATPEQVAQMAIDEDVDVVAMSLLNGAHMTAFPKVAKLIREKGGDDILLVGGGIIPDEDKPALEKQGITGNFGPGTPLKTIIEHVQTVVSERDSKKKR
jgi:methylmalonyl-CoA mutase C-terminal domain/subunit